VEIWAFRSLETIPEISPSLRPLELARTKAKNRREEKEEGRKAFGAIMQQKTHYQKDSPLNFSERDPFSVFSVPRVCFRLGRTDEEKEPPVCAIVVLHLPRALWRNGSERNRESSPEALK